MILKKKINKFEGKIKKDLSNWKDLLFLILGGIDAPSILYILFYKKIKRGKEYEKHFNFKRISKKKW